MITSGISVGNRIVSGIARVLSAPSQSDKLQEGEILVTEITDPDWDPILKKAAAIVTDKGGRTSHAAIVAREAGALALVGAMGATSKIKDGDLITVNCCEGPIGYVYNGKANWEEKNIQVDHFKLPDTNMMFILGDPDQAYSLAQLPNDGVGLMRLEFIINNSIRIHPMALVNYNELKDPLVKEKITILTEGYLDKEFYFVEKLSEAVGTIAAAFYPKEVIVRMSDFKTNEYANLIGGTEFEPLEENPMIGFRGASRYYSSQYKKGFRLECLAMKRVRETMGFDNVKLMIPFCRTVEEGKRVIATMEEYGLKQGVHGLEIYVMAEIPANIILAEEFSKIFDGFSIGSNDLTQLTLGIDRDSRIVSGLFDENNEAVQQSIQHVIEVARRNKKKIGICGQAPSDSPEFAARLLKFGIDSISFNADVYLESTMNIAKVEEKLKRVTT
jgi:pyruvate,water dikinase